MSQVGDRDDTGARAQDAHSGTGLPQAPQPSDSRPSAGPGPTGSRDHGHEGEVRLATLPWDITDSDDDRSLPPWFRRAVITVLALLVVYRILAWGFAELESFWYTLFFAFFIGLALEPIVNQLAIRGVRRGVGTILVMFGLLALTVIFFVVFGSLLADQLAQLVTSLPATLERVVDWINQKFGTQFNPNTILDSLGIGAGDIAKLATNLGVGLLSVLGTAIGWVFNIFTIALFAFYFAADGPAFRRAIASWMPPATQRTFLTVVDISTQKAGGYVVSRGLLAVISAIFHGVAFRVLDLPYWLPMAMWVGLVSQFIPTIGTYLAGALPVIIALVEGEPVKALIVLIAVIVYQQLENYFVAPRVTRSTLQIHPAVAFGSVIVGSALFGVFGALLAIPVVATIQSIVSVYGKRYDLVHEFGIAPDASDRERVRAAIRATDDHFGTGSRSGGASPDA